MNECHKDIGYPIAEKAKCGEWLYGVMNGI